MREIKFRIRNFKEVCVCHIWADPENVFIRASDGKAFYFDGFANSLLEYDAPENISIEQYTGLKDKNGKEIYEGDVFKWNDILYMVSFYDFSWSLYPVKETFMDVPIHFSNLNIEFMEIIGNIHENEDLING